jgi:hypothetical protein
METPKTAYGVTFYEHSFNITPKIGSKYFLALQRGVRVKRDNEQRLNQMEEQPIWKNLCKRRKCITFSSFFPFYIIYPILLKTSTNLFPL